MRRVLTALAFAALIGLGAFAAVAIAGGTNTASDATTMSSTTSSNSLTTTTSQSTTPSSTTLSTTTSTTGSTGTTTSANCEENCGPNPTPCDNADDRGGVSDGDDDDCAASTTTAATATTTTTEAPPTTVWVCHRTESKKHPFELIRVAQSAVAAHLRHGDVLADAGKSCPTVTTSAGSKRPESKPESHTEAKNGERDDSHGHHRSRSSEPAKRTAHHHGRASEPAKTAAHGESGHANRSGRGDSHHGAGKEER